MRCEHNPTNEGEHQSGSEIVYRLCGILGIAAHLKPVVRLGNIDNGVAATQEALCVEKLDLSPWGFIVSVLTASSDDEGD